MEEKRGEHDSPHQIPKLIHFVWAGGLLLMQPEGLNAVSEWCKKNPDCMVILWVDYQSYTPGEYDLIAKYSAAFSKRGVNVITDPSQKTENQPCILVKDIGSFRDEIFISEIGQLLPNYGSSSDILRLRILYEHGGCYFDQDVHQNPMCTLQESDVFNPRERHCIILEHHPQRPTPEKLVASYESGASFKIKSTESEKKSVSPREDSTPTEKSIGSEDAVESFSSDDVKEEMPPQQPSESTDDSYSRFMKLKLDELGNDAIITTKENPIIKLMIDKLENNYRLDPTQRDKIITECYGGLNRRNLTINRTGPDVQKDVLNKIQQFSFEDGKLILHCTPTNDTDPYASLELETAIEVDFEPMRSRARELTCPQENDQNWLKVFVREIKDGLLCRRAIIERIKFEAEHFKVLRLDDHLEHMAESMGISKNSVPFSENVKLLLKDISNLDLHNITLAKVTFAFPETIEFCQSHHLNSILNLAPIEFCMAVQQMAQLDNINYMLRIFEQRQIDRNLDTNTFAQCFPAEGLIPVKIQFEITLQTLTLLSLPQNITQLSINSQHELCQFVTSHKDMLSYGAKFLSHLDDSLLVRVDFIITSIERHQSLLDNPIAQKQLKSSTSDEYSDDQEKEDKHTHGK